MTKEDRIKFINVVFARIKNDLMRRIDDLPEHWEGAELYRWMADTFEEECGTMRRDKTRWRKYENDRLTHNL